MKKVKQIDFDSLTNREQRLLILKDVRSTILKKDSYIISKGSFLSINDEAVYRQGTSTKAFLQVNNIKECKVCARGALFLSKIKHNGDCQLIAGSWANNLCPSDKYLNETFSFLEIREIENIFEQCNYNNLSHISVETSIFKEHKIKADNILLLIINSMINNDGIFDIEKFRKYYPKTKIFKEAINGSKSEISS